jgi:D-alanyl-D-alanine dipeptidase
VPLGLFSDYPEIFTDSIYFGEREDSPYPTSDINGSLITCFVRRSVAKALRKAQRLLPDNLYLVVFDAYRTLRTQKALYDQYYQKLKELNPEWSEESLALGTQNYVALPSNNPACPSPHNTGGAVDVALYELPDGFHFNGSNPEIVQTRGKLLNFGTPFDYGKEESALSYFERIGEERALTPNEEEARNNRRILYWLMTKFGFMPIESEWWHFNSKETQKGAKKAGRNKATFGGVELSSDNLSHEEKRKMHYCEQTDKSKRQEISVSPRTSSFPIAMAIAPTNEQ